MINSISKSKIGNPPILATLLLIVIAVVAVVVSYFWVMTFTGSTTNQTGAAVLTAENVTYYNSSGLKVDITIKNYGTADAKVVEIYQGESSYDLQPVSSEIYYPASQIVSEGSSLKITFALSWIGGKRYYFKAVTEEGVSISFSESA